MRLGQWECCLGVQNEMSRRITLILQTHASKCVQKKMLKPWIFNIYLFLFIYSHSLKSIKLYIVQITSQNRLPIPQYNVLERCKIDQYKPLAKLMLIFLLADKAYMLQIGFTHSTWTGLTFPFSYLLFEQLQSWFQFSVVSD